MSAVKQDIDDCTLEDVQYHLYILEKIHNGLAAAQTGPVLTQAEAEAHFAQWLHE